jgi:uncharacterized repeat protein (TIGR03803 family)
MQSLPGKNSNIFWKSFAAAILGALLFISGVGLSLPAQAQTYTILHEFTGGFDGDSPEAGLTIDRSGNLEGTDFSGGSADQGTVFKLVHSGSRWTVSPLYSFAGGTDGAHPQARVIVGPDGNLYGTTYSGGTGNCLEFPGCGVVFKLSPPSTFCRSVQCPWNETVLYRFPGGPAGGNPGLGDLLFDSQGNIYGTTESGGEMGLGTVYELTPSNGTWVETVLHRFSGGTDGAVPEAGVIMDSAGNLYGTTVGGGLGQSGTVFELSPSGSGWTEQILHSFQSQTDGDYLTAGVIFDRSGNLYGAAQGGGPTGGGTVFELTPSGGSWTFAVLYSFANLGNGGDGPYSSLIMDQTGSLYDTTPGWNDGGNAGTIFKLTPSGGGWTYTLLHQFDFNDGYFPVGGVTLDASGNLYGTTSGGGTAGPGVAWEFMP